MKTNRQNQLLCSIFSSGLLIDPRALNRRLARIGRFLIAFLVLAAGFRIGAARAQTNYYHGLVNFTMGDAVMDLDANAHLVISNIGPSGNDGVQIATGEGHGATLNLGVYNPDVLPANASLHVAHIGQTNGVIQQIDVRNVPGGAAIFADFTGLGAPTVSVALYSNDTLVAFADGISPTNAVATFTTAGTPNGGGLPLILNPCILNPWDCYGNVDFILTMPDPTGPLG